MPELLAARNVVKRYGGVVALSEANVDVRAGEVLALIGANGSGKSTLSKIINGVVALDGGQLLLDGQPVNFPSPQAARSLGISTVFQELSLVPQMTVAENIWLAHEPLRPGGIVDQEAVQARTRELLALFEGTFKSNLRPEGPVSYLAPDERQIVEILKAVSFDPWLLILDEATASLDHRQVQRLFELVTQWKAAGKAIVFVSHRMEEILQIADRYAVLRNGKTVGAGQMKDVTTSDIVALMVGEAAVEKVVERRASAKRLAAQQVQLDVRDLRTPVLKGVSLQVHEGELLGLGGLKGQGQHHLLHSIFGDQPYEGTILIGGEEVRYRHPRQAMRHGLALVPGDRAGEGLLLIRSIFENFLTPSWQRYGFPLRIGQARQDSTAMSQRLSLKMGGLDQPVSVLSGGNAQKVVIGKWLMRNPRLLLLDDPTKGVDVGTKAEFYKLLSQLCDEGKSVVFYSSDDEELIGLCDRLLVMHDGTIRTELSGASLTKSNLVAASLGVAQETPP